MSPMHNEFSACIAIFDVMSRSRVGCFPSVVITFQLSLAMEDPAEIAVLTSEYISCMYTGKSDK